MVAGLVLALLIAVLAFVLYKFDLRPLRRMDSWARREMDELDKADGDDHRPT